ncbi:DUF488 domain-containing protein [Streptomyces sp. NPDC091265]|uniref:DUF488 domain-containing protein n=1 Tax=unclassified Streptomyces TaxID=2593676 RepID=UPI00344FB88E
MVADVRLTPISRKPGFSKTRLGHALDEAGIAYTHLRALGNPKDNRAAFWEGRISEGRARFRSLLRSEAAQADLDELAEHAGQARIAVLCFEKDEERCHRHVVLETLRKRTSLPVSPAASPAYASTAASPSTSVSSLSPSGSSSRRASSRSTRSSRSTYAATTRIPGPRACARTRIPQGHRQDRHERRLARTLLDRPPAHRPVSVRHQTGPAGARNFPWPLPPSGRHRQFPPRPS